MKITQGYDNLSLQKFKTCSAKLSYLNLKKWSSILQRNSKLFTSDFAIFLYHVDYHYPLPSTQSTTPSMTLKGPISCYVSLYRYYSIMNCVIQFLNLDALVNLKYDSYILSNRCLCMTHYIVGGTYGFQAYKNDVKKCMVEMYFIGIVFLVS